MAAKNLRIVYNNLGDNCTYTASTAASPIANVKSDLRTRVYRSSTGATSTTYTTIILDSGVGNTMTINSIILARTNLTAAATIQVRAWSTPPTSLGATVDTVPSITGGSSSSTPIAALTNPLPYQIAGLDYWGIAAPTTSTAREGYARVYFPTDVTARAFTIELVDTNNPDKFIEISRIIAGKYWSPTYNTGYGLSITTNDLSSNNRTEAGDIVTTVRPSYDILSFDLKYMNIADRKELQKIIKRNKMAKPVFISLFPDNTDDFSKEQQYQLYGKMSQLFPVEHPLYEMYSSKLDIEEI